LWCSRWSSCSLRERAGAIRTPAAGNFSLTHYRLRRSQKPYNGRIGGIPASGTIATIRRQIPRSNQVTFPLRTLACAALIVLALLSATARGAAAARTATSTPCWKTLLNDWYDGRIEGTYAIHCYKDALKHLPKDVNTYSSARDDIERALQSARLAARKTHATLGPDSVVKPPKATTTTTPNGLGGLPITTGTGKKPAKGLSGLADKLNPASPTALPIPLLVLGSLALLLVAAGGAGLVAKRLQDRRQSP
jgi:hypothetical protein